jgi:two-component system NtrC family sensor kinase
LNQIKAGACKATCIQKGIASDGGELWVEILGTPVKDKSGQTIGIVEVIADVTERKRMEAELLQASKLAAMGELVSGFAHEINNPLTIISGNVQLFLGRVAAIAENNPEIQKLLNEYLRTVLDETERAARIVRNLVTFSRKSPAERRLMDLNEAVRKTVELRSYELSVDGVETRLELSPNLPRVNAGFNQIQQVLFNLLNNAAAALKEVRDDRAITIRSWAAEDHVFVSVSDTGPGVAEIYRDRVFDPFFSTKEIGKGTGLGLSICHGIIESHGGSIWLERTEGRGATFAFALPLGTSTEALKETPPKEPEPSPLEDRKKVLVVDDEPDVLYVLEEGLRSDTLLVYPAQGGEEALRQMEKRRFDLILADVKMPKMDGREFYERVREKDPELARRIVFITGDVLSPDTREFIDQTGNASVMKPFSLDKVRAVVLRTIHETQSVSANREGES